MKKGNTLLTKLAAIALGAVLTVGVGATLSAVNPSREVEAATTLTRRIWVKVKSGSWWNDDGADTYVYNWNSGSGNWLVAWPGTKVIDASAPTERYDSPNGYYYIDVPATYDKFKFARVNPNNSANIWNQTGENNLGEQQSYWFAEIETDAKVNWSNNNNPATTTVVKNYADSLDTYAEACSEAKAQAAVDTYNGLSSFEQDQFDAYIYSGYSGQQGTDLNGKTGLQVLNYLRARYNIQTELNSVNSNIFSENGKIGLIVSISIVGLTSLAGLYLLNRKRKSAEF